MIVSAVNTINQKETKADSFLENNTVLKELIKSGTKAIGLYFDGAAHDDWSWLIAKIHQFIMIFGNTLHDLLIS
jgi:hypothetical protein